MEEGKGIYKSNCRSSTSTAAVTTTTTTTATTSTQQNDIKSRQRCQTDM